jgi:molybdopterin-guanine dinucleotide biosynthesis protein A
MGGVVKGLLPSPDGGEPIVTRLLRVSREALPGAEVVLVGEAAAYSALGLTALPDTPSGVGPLGGLAALLTRAEERGVPALALAGDLPFVTSDLVKFVAGHAPDAAATAPRLDGTWQPLFARYAPGPCLPLVRAMLSEGRLAPWRLLDALGARAVPITLPDALSARLADWDTPEDTEQPSPDPSASEAGARVRD